MKLRLHRPDTMEDAIQLLARFGDEAGLLAGGTELLLLLRLGLARYEHLVSLTGLPGVSELSLSPDGDLYMGCGVTHQQVADSPVIRVANPELARAEGRLANLRVRLAGTLAGNLVFADPHSDTLTLLTALDAELECTGPDGTRRVRVAEFVLEPFITVLAPGEIITRIIVPARWLASTLAHERFESRRQRPLVTVSCAASTRPDGLLEDLRLVVGSASPTPVVLGSIAEVFAGRGSSEVDDAVLAEAGRAAAESVPVRDDEDSSAAYKANLVSVLTVRALRRALPA